MDIHKRNNFAWQSGGWHASTIAVMCSSYWIQNATQKSFGLVDGGWNAELDHPTIICDKYLQNNQWRLQSLDTFKDCQRDDYSVLLWWRTSINSISSFAYMSMEISRNSLLLLVGRSGFMVISKMTFLVDAPCHCCQCLGGQFCKYHFAWSHRTKDTQYWTHSIFPTIVCADIIFFKAEESFFFVAYTLLMLLHVFK